MLHALHSPADMDGLSRADILKNLEDGGTCLSDEDLIHHEEKTAALLSGGIIHSYADVDRYTDRFLEDGGLAVKMAGLFEQLIQAADMYGQEPRIETWERISSVRDSLYELICSISIENE